MNKSLETKVDFYILSDASIETRQQFTCELIEKLHSTGKNILVLTDDIKEKTLDKLLWSFKGTSFIAHEVYTEGKDISLPLPNVIFVQKTSEIDYFCKQYNFNVDVLLDLSLEPITLMFSRVITVANQMPKILLSSRTKYRLYLDLGIKPDIYRIKNDT